MPESASRGGIGSDGVGKGEGVGLEEYKRKRDFGRTPEPSGGVERRRADDGLQFVVQKHDASHLHYDFRLELGGVLKSWAVPKGPSMVPGVKRLAMETEDHPMEYGGFEGVIPEGQYGGGTVMLWDRGAWIPDGEPTRGYREGRLRFRLDGEKLRGEWILTRMRPKPGERKPSWLLIKARDPAARKKGEPEITEDAPRSVSTGRDLAEIAAESDRVWDSREGEVGDGTATVAAAAGVDPADVEGARKRPAPKAIRPQLATLTADPPTGEEWLHELKFDGYRVIVRIDGADAKLITRNGKEWTDRFPDVAAAVTRIRCRTAILDGEVVVLDERGITSFQALQNSLAGNRAGEPLLYVFDLLYLDGWDLTGAPLEARKDVLARLLRDPPARIRYSDHVRGQGRSFFEQACTLGVEGIIAKRADRPYRPGRGREWLKIKCSARQEFVVVGYTDPSGSRVGLGALLLGVHDGEGALRYAGKVGTGFDTRTLEMLTERLSALEQPTSPLTDPPRGAAARGVHWVRPELVAEVEFTEWTDDGRIRHPSFQGLRQDKSPVDVVRESPAGAAEGPLPGRSRSRGGAGGAKVPRKAAGGAMRVAGVRISSPDRVLWPEQGVTKGELVEYYVAVADAMLPRLVDRPLTLVRCPSGADSKCFYQKHANESVPELVPRVDIEERDGTEPYMYVDGLPALLGLVQLGVLEFHIWGSRRDRLDRPDRLVIDLDPDEDLPFGHVVEAALRLRDRLGELGLESFAKSTGGKGLHVVAPITRRSDWEDARAFTQAVARELVAAEPDRYTAKMTKSRRSGRIYVDYLRNARNATAIADYSTRARPGAPVATPIAWDELSPRLRRPPFFSIRDLPARLAEGGDPWVGYDGLRQSITTAMKDAVGVR